MSHKLEMYLISININIILCRSHRIRKIGEKSILYVINFMNVCVKLQEVTDSVRISQTRVSLFFIVHI